jgi:hypothetical protein
MLAVRDASDTRLKLRFAPEAVNSFLLVRTTISAESTSKSRLMPFAYSEDFGAWSAHDETNSNLQYGVRSF